jgi:hypothetical protein
MSAADEEDHPEHGDNNGEHRKHDPDDEGDAQPARESGQQLPEQRECDRSEQYCTCQVPDGGLKWEYINFRAGVIRLPRSKAGEKPREIPMNSVLRKTLRSLPQKIDSPYVFDGTDPEKWFAKLVKAAGIKDFTWHDLRHTFASQARDGRRLHAPHRRADGPLGDSDHDEVRAPGAGAPCRCRRKAGGKAGPN